MAYVPCSDLIQAGIMVCNIILVVLAYVKVITNKKIIAQAPIWDGYFLT